MPCKAQPACKIISRPDVITGENVQTSETAQEHVLCAPASDPVQAHQPRDDLSVPKWFQAFQVKASIDDRSGEIDDGRSFAEAETERTQGWRLEAGEILWTGERVHQHPVYPNCVSVAFGESVEQAQAGLER